MERIRLHGTEMISATNIRRHIIAGNVGLAAKLLGRPYALTGTVVHGAKRGRTIGYPTANLEHDAELVVPALGIYATVVDVPGVVTGHAAMTSVGVRPVFDNGERQVEAHLLDWSGDLYDRPLALHFLEWLRPEENFPSVEALVVQMARDGLATQEVVRAWQQESEQDNGLAADNCPGMVCRQLTRNQPHGRCEGVHIALESLGLAGERHDDVSPSSWPSSQARNDRAGTAR